MIHYWRKRYRPTGGMTADYWHKVAHNYYNLKKRVGCSSDHWYVITYKDGRKELAYLKVRYSLRPHGGRLCRGVILPSYWGVTDFEHARNIELAF